MSTKKHKTIWYNKWTFKHGKIKKQTQVKQSKTIQNEEISLLTGQKLYQ